MVGSSPADDVQGSASGVRPGLPGEGTWAVAPFAALTQARTGRGLSREDVARLLSLRPTYVAAMEEGRLGELPGLGPARSMLSRYAVLVGLDSESLVASCYVSSYFPQPTYTGSQRMNRRRSVSGRRFVTWGAVQWGPLSMLEGSPPISLGHGGAESGDSAYHTGMLVSGLTLVLLGLSLVVVDMLW